MALTAVPFTYSKFPLKILNKGPEFFKTQAEKREEKKKSRKTATELLAESRHRYVKSPTFDCSDGDLGRNPEVEVVHEQPLQCPSNDYDNVDSGRINNHEAINNNSVDSEVRTMVKHAGLAKPPLPKKPVNLVKPKTRSPDFHDRNASFDSGVYASPAVNHMHSSGALFHTKTQETQTDVFMSTGEDQLNGNDPTRTVNTNNGLKIQHFKSKSAPVVNMDYVSRMVSMFNNMGEDDEKTDDSPTEKLDKDTVYFNYHNTDEPEDYESTENIHRPKSPCARRHARRHHTVTCGSRDNLAVRPKSPRSAWREPDYDTVPRSPKPSTNDFSSLRKNSQTKSPRIMRRVWPMDDGDNCDRTLAKSCKSEKQSCSYYGSLRRDQLSKSQGLHGHDSWQQNDIYTFTKRPKSEHHRSDTIGSTRRNSLGKSQAYSQRMDAVQREDSPCSEKRPSRKYSEDSGRDRTLKSPSKLRHGGKPTALSLSPTRRIETKRSPSNDGKSTLESQLLSLLLTEFEYKTEVDGKASPISDAGFDSKGDSVKWSSTYRSDKSQGNNCDVPEVAVKPTIDYDQRELNYGGSGRGGYNLEENLIKRGAGDFSYLVVNHSDFDITDKPYTEEHDRSNSPFNTGLQTVRRRVHRSKSDVSNRLSKESFGSELDKFFNAMGMDHPLVWYSDWGRTEDIFHMMHGPRDRSSVSGDSHWEEISWRSSRSTKGPFRMGIPDRLPDTSQSVVMKNARIIKWLCECRKARSRSIS